MQAHLRRLREFKRSDARRTRVQRALDALARAANDPTDNVFARVVEAAEAGCTHGEICGTAAARSSASATCRRSCEARPRQRLPPPRGEPVASRRCTPVTGARLAARISRLERGDRSAPAIWRLLARAAGTRPCGGHHRRAGRRQVDADPCAAGCVAAQRPAHRRGRGRSVQPDDRRRRARRPRAHGRARRASGRVHPLGGLARSPRRPVRADARHRRRARRGRLRHRDRRDRRCRAVRSRDPAGGRHARRGLSAGPGRRRPGDQGRHPGNRRRAGGQQGRPARRRRDRARPARHAASARGPRTGRLGRAGAWRQCCRRQGRT